MKRMKRMKRMIAAAAILIILLSLCACQKDEADYLNDLSGTTERIPGMIDMESTGQATKDPFSSDEDADGESIQEPEDEDILTDETTSEEGKYASEWLYPLFSSNELGFESLGDNRCPYFRAADGTLRRIDSSDEILLEKGTADNAFVFSRNQLGHPISKGLYQIELNDVTCFVRDIKGELLGGWYETTGGKSNVFSVDKDGNIYFNRSDENAVKVVYDNTKVYLEDNKTEEIYDRVDRIEIINNYVYAEVGDVSLAGSILVLPYNDGLKVSLKRLDAGIKIWDYGYYGMTLYSCNDSDTSLYYISGGKTIAYDLPEGYKVRDLKKVFLDKTIYLVMKDGSMFYSELIHNEPPYYEKHEVTFDKSVVELYHLHITSRHAYLYALMDDGVFYKVS